MSVIKKGGTQFGQVHLPGQAFHDGVLPFTRFAFVYPHVVCFLLHDQVEQERRNFQVFIQLSPKSKDSVPSDNTSTSKTGRLRVSRSLWSEGSHV